MKRLKQQQPRLTLLTWGREPSSQAKSQPEPCTERSWSTYLRARLDGRIIDFAYIPVSVQVMLVGGRRASGGGGQEEGTF